MNEIIKKNAIFYGIITGIISVLFTTLVYSVDLNLFTNWWLNSIMMLVFIVIGVILLSKTKKELKGIFPFKEAFTTYFLSAIIGSFISICFSILLFNVIDTGAKETLNELLIKSTVETLEKFGTPTLAIDETVKKMQEKNPYETLALLQGFVFSMIGSAIFGLILALFFRSKPSQE